MWFRCMSFSLAVVWCVYDTAVQWTDIKTGGLFASEVGRDFAPLFSVPFEQLNIVVGVLA